MYWLWKNATFVIQFVRQHSLFKFLLLSDLLKKPINFVTCFWSGVANSTCILHPGFYTGGHSKIFPLPPDLSFLLATTSQLKKPPVATSERLDFKSFLQGDTPSKCSVLHMINSFSFLTNHPV